MIQPSRILNEKNGFLGLSYFDCALLMGVTLQIHGLFSIYELEWAGIGVGVLLFLSLIQIRLKYRRGIVASFIYFWLRSRTIRQPQFKREESWILRMKYELYSQLVRQKWKRR